MYNLPNSDSSFDIDTEDLPNNKSDLFFILLLNTTFSGDHSLLIGEVNFIAPDDSVIEAKMGNFSGPLYYINLNSATDIQDGFYKIEDSDTKEVLAEYNFS